MQSLLPAHLSTNTTGITFIIITIITIIINSNNNETAHLSTNTTGINGVVTFIVMTVINNNNKIPISLPTFPPLQQQVLLLIVSARKCIPDICHFFTQAKFLESKIYTEKTRKLRQNTQLIANFWRYYYGKIHSKLPKFCVKSEKIYIGQKKFTRTCPWRP